MMRPRFVALVVPVTALACGHEEASTPLAPPAGSSNVTVQAAPVEGAFTVRVFESDELFSGGCETEVFPAGDPPTYTLSTQESVEFCLQVEATSPADADGSVVLSGCALPRSKAEFTTHAPSTSCTERGGDGHWKQLETLSGTGEWVFFQVLPSGAAGASPRGFRAQYRGMGSGVRNQTLPPFDVTRPAQ